MATVTTVVVVTVGVEQRHPPCDCPLPHRPSPSQLPPLRCPDDAYTIWSLEINVREQGQQAAPGLIVYLFGAGLYYEPTRFSQEILKLVDGAEPKIKWFAIEAAAITYIDFTAADTFQQVHKTLQKRDVTLVLSNVVDNVQKDFDHYGLTALIGEEHFFDTLPEILEAYQNEFNKVVEEPITEENIPIVDSI